MDRLEENRVFLEQLLHAATLVRKSLIKHCTDEQLKTIIEVVINLNSFPYRKTEIKELNKVKPLLNTLFKRRKASVKVFRSLILKYHNLLSIIISTILSKISEGSFCKFLSESG
jgi:hypothetical protein